MSADDDYKFMQRCIDLAGKAEGLTYPNPLVGSVVVNEGRIIGEGFHMRSGTAHAEVVAINSVRDQSLLSSSTIYVNLEPCSHYGKTPPCADFIISKGIRRVVAGMVDPYEQVAGKGIAKLRNAGFEVIAGVLENKCRHLNRRFITFHEKRRPYIILKWARSKDGFIDSERAEGSEGPNWISGKPERVLVHRWRSEEQAILTGAETVRRDNPRLNVREWPGNNPLRLVLSSSGLIGKGRALVTDAGGATVFTHSDIKEHAGLEYKVLNPGEPSAGQVVKYLYESGIQSLFIEGGASVLNHFIAEGLWDEMRVFTGAVNFGSGVPSPPVTGEVLSVTEFSGSRLTISLNINKSSQKNQNT